MGRKASVFPVGLFLGIDPGTQKTNLGLGIVDQDGLLVHSGIVEVAEFPKPLRTVSEPYSDQFWNLSMRLSIAFEKARFKISSSVLLAGIEDQWVGPNRQVGLRLSKQWGVIFNVLAAYSIYSVRIQPVQAKKALSGNHRAKKGEMVLCAKAIGMEGDNDNEADAIGVALAARVKYQEWYLGCLQ